MGKTPRKQSLSARLKEVRRYGHEVLLETLDGEVLKPAVPVRELKIPVSHFASDKAQDLLRAFASDSDESVSQRRGKTALFRKRKRRGSSEDLVSDWQREQLEQEDEKLALMDGTSKYFKMNRTPRKSGKKVIFCKRCCTILYHSWNTNVAVAIFNCGISTIL